MNFQPTLLLHHQQLQLKGFAKRKTMLIDMYAAAFYCNATLHSTQEAIDIEEVKGLSTIILAPIITGSLLAQLFKDGLSKTVAGKLESVQAPIQEILHILKKSSVKRKDRFDFLYLPEEGFKAFQNEMLIFESDNKDIFKAIAEVYIGKYHDDQSIPEKIIGLIPS